MFTLASVCHMLLLFHKLEPTSCRDESLTHDALRLERIMSKWRSDLFSFSVYASDRYLLCRNAAFIGSTLDTLLGSCSCSLEEILNCCLCSLWCVYGVHQICKYSTWSTLKFCWCLHDCKTFTEHHEFGLELSDAASLALLQNQPRWTATWIVAIKKKSLV